MRTNFYSKYFRIYRCILTALLFLLCAADIASSQSHTPYELSGSITVDGSERVIRDQDITPGNGAQPEIIIRNGGTLTLSNVLFRGKNKTSSNAGSVKITVSAGSTLILDSCEIAGSTSGSAPEPGAYIFVSGGTLRIQNHTKIRDINGTRDCSGDSCALIRAENGDISVNDSEFRGNAFNGGNGGIFHMLNGSLRIGNDNSFTANSSGDRGSVIYADNSILEIGERNLFEGNSSAHSGGAIYTSSTSVQIRSDNTFRNNTTQISGGAIYVSRGNLTIDDGNLFEKNGNAWYGGALYLDQTVLSVGASEFVENTSAVFGGAIDAVSSAAALDGTTFTNNISSDHGLEGGSGYGGAIRMYGTPPTVQGIPQKSLTIHDAAFTGNIAGIRGGAISLGIWRDDTSEEKVRNRISAEISKTEFIGNQVEVGYEKLAGGALFIGYDAAVTMNRAAIIDNRSDTVGGAIARDLAGTVWLTERNGAIIYDNRAGTAPEGYPDIFSPRDFPEGSGNVLYPQAMFNGGWHYFQISDMRWGGTGIYERMCGVIGSNPTDRDVSGADVIFRDNEAHRYDYGFEDPGPDWDVTAGGGAIAVIGNLRVGEDYRSFSVQKEWTDAGAEKPVRPSMKDFPNDLLLFRDDVPYPLGNMKYHTDVETESGIWVLTYDENDPNIKMKVMPAENDPNNIWYAAISGLPADGEWTVGESPELLEYYDAEISGDMFMFFTIRNTWNGKLPPDPTATPTMTPEPQPTLTPTPTPLSGINMFPILEDLDVLPQTGF